ncbi:sporulation histidine kinase inhibitor Sda [Virgibacillus kimchii]
MNSDNCFKRSIQYPTLSDEQLLEAYTKAAKLNLDYRFIYMLENEIANRKIKK